MPFCCFDLVYATCSTLREENEDVVAAFGDDAFELYYDGSVIDVFGDVNVDGPPPGYHCVRSKAIPNGTVHNPTARNSLPCRQVMPLQL